MSKIQKIILEKGDTDDLIPAIKELWKTCQNIKKYYPSVWKALANQYWLEIFPKVLSDKLFDQKLELLFLQDDELRNK